MNVPPSDPCAATGVAAAAMRFVPQIRIVWPLLPVMAEWLAGVAAVQGLPAVLGVASTRASRICQEYTVIPRPVPSAEAAVVRLGLSNWLDLLTITPQVPVRSALPARVVALTWKFELLVPGAISSAVPSALRERHIVSLR